jgi:peptidoglycan/xylan/chitin deacetylase (PgdA/CDA1 family)
VPPARIAFWVATIGAFALVIRSLVIGPIPTWLALFALCAYATYATLGVLVPQLEMYGDIVWHGEPGRRAVALTFDDGPHPASTRRILEILARGGHRATFFVVGRKVEQHPDVVRELCEAGHDVALHGYEHDRLYCFKPPSWVEADIRRSQQALEAACGRRATLFRPPVGYTSHRTTIGARRAGVTLVAWSARGIDGLGEADPQRVARRIERKLRDGAIVMLHDASERDDFQPASVEALPRILRALEERGLRAVTVDELFEDAAQSEG